MSRNVNDIIRDLPAHRRRKVERRAKSLIVAELNHLRDHQRQTNLTARRSPSPPH